MKKMLSALCVAALTLSGCLNESSVKEKQLISYNDFIDQDNYHWDHSSDGPGYYCSSEIYEVALNNHSYFVSVPSECDPYTYIYNGDPGPDMGEEYKNMDQSFQDQLIQLAIVTHNIN